MTSTDSLWVTRCMTSFKWTVDELYAGIVTPHDPQVNEALHYVTLRSLPIMFLYAGRNHYHGASLNTAKKSVRIEKLICFENVFLIKFRQHAFNVPSRPQKFAEP